MISYFICYSILNPISNMFRNKPSYNVFSFFKYVKSEYLDFPLFNEVKADHVIPGKVHNNNKALSFL